MIPRSISAFDGDHAAQPSPLPVLTRSGPSDFHPSCNLHVSGSVSTHSLGIGMRRRDFIAGTAATAAMNVARPVCAQTQFLVINRIAIVDPAIRAEELTINGHAGLKAYFVALTNRGFIEGQNLTVE